MDTASSDRDRWNARYRQSDRAGVPVLLGRDLHLLPRSGRALDVAGGSGAAAAILAARGLTVTVVDVSDVALALAAERAEQSRLQVETRQIDLTAEPLPEGPWAVITCFDYLDRSLFAPMVEQLAPGGMLVVSIATRTNLERHERPGPRYLLDDGELRSLLDGLELLVYRERWNLDGRHTADAIAVR
jgi:2-polyprenyl-3-methyl-5-hydroxy-6-metoxy-1,4-benzoquinol methylase